MKICNFQIRVLLFGLTSEICCANRKTSGKEYIMIDNESVLQYKFYLCRKFLEKLLREGHISEQQRKKTEAAVLKKLTV